MQVHETKNPFNKRGRKPRKDGYTKVNGYTPRTMELPLQHPGGSIVSSAIPWYPRIQDKRRYLRSAKISIAAPTDAQFDPKRKRISTPRYQESASGCSAARVGFPARDPARHHPCKPHTSRRIPSPHFARRPPVH